MLSFAEIADDNAIQESASQIPAEPTPASVVSLDGATLYKSEASVSYAVELSQLCHAHAIEEEALVIKICTAISMSLPQLPEERMHHAMFNKHMYLDGEITFQRFILKMRNLFPNRMEQLSDDLRAAIAKMGGEAH
ncbi:MAG: hypothetical protein MRY32_03605 [Rickettsiales bacterium]|nr:hypothetical protein [Rickettsiales bacterium]